MGTVMENDDGSWSIWPGAIRWKTCLPGSWTACSLCRWELLPQADAGDIPVASGGERRVCADYRTPTLYSHTVSRTWLPSRVYSPR